MAYWDGQFDDARYGTALVKSFSDAGGEAVNYLKVVDFERGSGASITAALAKDVSTGERAYPPREGLSERHRTLF